MVTEGRESEIDKLDSELRAELKKSEDRIAELSSISTILDELARQRARNAQLEKTLDEMRSCANDLADKLDSKKSKELNCKQKREYLRWTYMPKYGEQNFNQLIEALSEAKFGDRTHSNVGVSDDHFVGHQIIPQINFNSLNRIVSAFVNAAQRDAELKTLEKAAGVVSKMADLLVDEAEEFHQDDQLDAAENSETQAGILDRAEKAIRKLKEDL